MIPYPMVLAEWEGLIPFLIFIALIIASVVSTARKAKKEEEQRRRRREERMRQEGQGQGTPPSNVPTRQGQQPVDGAAPRPTIRPSYTQPTQPSGTGGGSVLDEIRQMLETGAAAPPRQTPSTPPTEARPAAPSRQEPDNRYGGPASQGPPPPHVSEASRPTPPPRRQPARRPVGEVSTADFAAAVEKKEEAVQERAMTQAQAVQQKKLQLQETVAKRTASARQTLGQRQTEVSQAMQRNMMKMRQQVSQGNQAKQAAPTGPETAQPCKGIEIVDGDSLRVRFRKQEETVRLLRIKAPGEGEPGYRRSAVALKELVKGKELKLDFERPGMVQRDRYGRLLAYLYADGDHVNVQMVRQGWAKFWTDFGSGRLKNDFAKAQELARSETKGLWKIVSETARHKLARMMTGTPLTHAFVMMEILGKPKADRRQGSDTIPGLQ